MCIKSQVDEYCLVLSLWEEEFSISSKIRRFERPLVDAYFHSF